MSATNLHYAECPTETPWGQKIDVYPIGEEILLVVSDTHAGYWCRPPGLVLRRADLARRTPDPSRR